MDNTNKKGIEMRLILLLFPCFMYAMDRDIEMGSIARTPSPDDLIRSHPIAIPSPDSRPPTPLFIGPVPPQELNSDQICEAVLHVYFRGNGDRIKPAVLPHLKKQVSGIVESDSDLERKIEIFRIAQQIRNLSAISDILHPDQMAPHTRSILTPRIQNMVADAITQALDEKDHSVQIHAQNALTAHQKYKLAHTKYLLALCSNVLTAFITSLLASTIAIIVHFS